MTYILLGGALLALIFWGRGKSILKRREWRFATAILALVAFAGAAYAGVRGAWGPAVVLLVVGLWLSVTTRIANPAKPAAKPVQGMSVAEARSILGVGAEATAGQVQAAYTRLMRLAHPDKGGTAGLAAQLNAARDTLLRK